MRWAESVTAISGISLILGFAFMMLGALLFISRPQDLPSVPAPPRLVIERALIMAAVLLTIIGLLLLGEQAAPSGGAAWLKVGAYTYLVAGVILLTAESMGLSQSTDSYPLIVVYVVLAFLAQAALGLGIVGSGSLPSVVGWITLGWSVVWLVFLPLLTPADMYFPVLHHLMPLAIGISLLLSR